MARVEIANTVQRPTGEAVRKATVQVNLRNGAAATVYADEVSGATLSNPLTTDANGRIEGWVEEGSYDLVVSAPGLTSYTQKFEAVRGDKRFPASSTGAVCFTWDDAYASHATVQALADARGQKHTFAIVSGFLGTAGKLTSAQVAAMYAAGHEIASHSVDHAHVATGGLTIAQRVAQYDNSKTVIEAIIGAGNCRTWVYPYGERNATTDTELYLRYDRLLCTGNFSSGIHPVYDTVQTFGRSSFLIGRLDWNGSVQSQARVLDLITTASRYPIIVLVYAHDIDSANNPTMVQVQQAMDLAHTLGVPCVTTAQAFGSLPSIIDAGFEEGALNGWDTAVGSPGPTATVVNDAAAINALGFNGASAAKLSCADAANFVYIRQSVPVVPNLQYTFSGRVRAAISSGAGQVVTRIVERDVTGASIGTTTSPNITSGSYVQAVATRTMGQTASFVYIDCLVNLLVADAWFDHLHFGPTNLGSYG